MKIRHTRPPALRRKTVTPVATCDPVVRERTAPKMDEFSIALTRSAAIAGLVVAAIQGMLIGLIFSQLLGSMKTVEHNTVATENAVKEFREESSYLHQREYEKSTDRTMAWVNDFWARYWAHEYARICQFHDPQCSKALFGHWNQ